jgi:hypothetical protein
MEGIRISVGELPRRGGEWIYRYFQSIEKKAVKLGTGLKNEFVNGKMIAPIFNQHFRLLVAGDFSRSGESLQTTEILPKY